MPNSLFLALVWLVAVSEPAAAISYCADAGRFLEHSTHQDREDVLRRIVALCPRHADALNNLAVLLEERGELDEAEALYRRAIAADPDSIAPHAGLGDVLMERENFAAAAASYRTFLDRLDAAAQLGAAAALRSHAALYRRRLDEAQAAAGAAGQAAAPDAVVPARQILRSLTSVPPHTRGLGLQQRTEPHIDLHIRFDFDSDRLRPEAERQIDEVAGALSDNFLKERRILIEGHTDSTGPAAYNRSLSERRAAAVRAALIARGVDPAQISAAGFGESRPLADNATARGQSINRRVTFVNVGGR